MDVDKESRKESALAEGSQLQLLADSLYIGSAEDDTKSKWAQVAADKVKLFGTTTAELQQDKDKGLVALDGGKVTVGKSPLTTSCSGTWMMLVNP